MGSCTGTIVGNHNLAPLCSESSSWLPGSGGGALVPFVGPTFGYGMGGTAAWTWSESHLTLHLLPGIAAALGGALLVRGRRATQVAGALSMDA